MPTWSPDRQSLIYTGYRDRKQQIIQRDLATGDEEILVSPASLNITATFAPNGQSITYAAAKEGNSDIYQLSLDSRSPKQLTSHHSADLSPSWSPSGRHLAFTSDRGGRPQIYIMDVDGSNVRRLTYDGGLQCCSSMVSKKGIGLSMSAVYQVKDLNSVGLVQMENNEAKLPEAIVSTIHLHGLQMVDILSLVPSVEEKVRSISLRAREQDWRKFRRLGLT